MLLTVLHLAARVIVHCLLLVCYPLPACLHRTAALVKQIPLAANMLLAVLHLAARVVVHCLLLVCYPLPAEFHDTVRSEQIPLSVNLSLTGYGLAVDIVVRLVACSSLPAVLRNRLDDNRRLALIFQLTSGTIKHILRYVDCIFTEHLMTVSVIVVLPAVQGQPSRCHGTAAVIEVIPVFADLLRTVLHLTFGVVVDFLLLISYPLPARLHRTRHSVKQIPLAANMLLAVLHLPV